MFFRDGVPRINVAVVAFTMPLKYSIAALREANEPVPELMRLPTEAEVGQAEEALAVRFHSDFRQFLLKASDVVVGAFETVTLTLPGAHTHLIDVTKAAHQLGVPKDWIPICEDNGDYYCMTPQGAVRFWAHDGASDESWESLGDWIDEVWLET